MITQPDIDAPYAAATTVTDGVITVYASQLVTLGRLVGGTDGAGGLVGEISDTLKTLFNTLSALELGWQGQTQAEAKKFADRLDACLTTLLGTDDEDAKYSVLNRVAVALSSSGNNYLLAEDAVVKMFTEFGANISRSGDASGAGTSINDATRTAISEIF
ncbi:hypothetical protein [Streptomyces sp. NPDC019224]|uniref:hypothetical protein n=1 Tax=Streptomyces sp. NPDC019224 TaxID=3154484 RepID=UPI003403CACB